VPDVASRGLSAACSLSPSRIADRKPLLFSTAGRNVKITFPGSREHHNLSRLHAVEILNIWCRPAAGLQEISGHSHTGECISPFIRCRVDSEFLFPVLRLLTGLRILPTKQAPIDTMDLASLYFGLFLAVFVFTLTKVVVQTRVIWRRTRSLANPYLWMIWVEAWVNLAFALSTFLFINGVIHGR
jgi:hypothetical protein